MIRRSYREFVGVVADVLDDLKIELLADCHARLRKITSHNSRRGYWYAEYLFCRLGVWDDPTFFVDK